MAHALFEAVRVEGASSPYDTLHLKIFYPADRSAKNSIVVLPDAQAAPFPVVIFFNGINCGAELYQWLAVKLADRGLVVITFTWIADNLPGIIALTPGVDFNSLRPDAYGKSITASALPTLLGAIDRLQAKGILAGLLDLERIVLGGHSAGGRVAIESANPQLVSQVSAAFAYGAHTAAAVQLGFPPATILPLPDALPLMLIGGTQDGVIAQSGHLYGVSWQQPTTPLVRTFQEAIAVGRGDSYLLLLEGANHYCITHPIDETTCQSIDFLAAQPAAQLREVLAEAIGLFIDAEVRQQAEALKRLSAFNNPLVAAFERK